METFQSAPSNKQHQDEGTYLVWRALSNDFKQSSLSFFKIILLCNICYIISVLFDATFITFCECTLSYAPPFLSYYKFIELKYQKLMMKEIPA